MKVSKKTTGALLVLAGCFIGVAHGETITVESGDTPSELAAKFCGGANNHKLVWSGDSKRLPIGHVITLPQECAKGGDKKQREEIRVETTDVAGVAPRIFKNPGAKPLCPSFKKDPKSCAKVFDKALANEGFDEATRSAVIENAVSGKAEDAVRPNGYGWERFISGQGDIWGTTEVGVPGGDVAVKVCPLAGDKQVDVVVACGNLGINTVIIPERSVVTEVLEISPKRGGCKMDWLLMGQYARGKDMRNVSGSGQATCQFPIDEKWSDGPLLTGGTYRYKGGSWSESSRMVSLGNRLEGKDVWNLAKAQWDLSIAYASTRGGDGANVMKPPISGLDITTNLHAKKYFSLGSDQGENNRESNAPVSAEGISFSLTSGDSKEEEDRVLGEFSLYGTYPITNTSGPVYWKDQIVATDSRHPVIGVSARFGWELNGWEVIPEVELGGWHTRGIKNPWGVEVSVGIATRDRFFRAHIGAGYSGDVYGVVKVEFNGGGQLLFASAQEAVKKTVEGATDSRIGLGLDPAPKESRVVPVSPVETQQSAVSRKPETERESTSPQPKATVKHEEWRGWNNSTRFTVVPVKGKAEVSTPPQQAEPTFGFNDR